MIIASGSSENVVSKALVKTLNLKIERDLFLGPKSSSARGLQSSFINREILQR